MQSWLVISLLWFGFGASHIAMSHTPVRNAVIGKVGAKAFMGLYSLVSFAFFIPLVSFYLDHRHEGALLWDLVLIPGVKHAAMLLALIGIAVTISGYFQMPPNGFVPMKNKSPRGLTRITRHPMFMFLGLWGLSHCLINGYASDVAFFGGFAVFAVLGCMHQDSRKRQLPEFKEYYAYTSLLPFGAQLSGRGGIVIAELPWLGLLVGVAVAVGFYLAHNALFF